jgi:hypothetical protein
MNDPRMIEAVVLSAVTSETKANGEVRKVTFLLPNDGEHPFRGKIGERIGLVCIKLGENEHEPRGGDVARTAAKYAAPMIAKQLEETVAPFLDKPAKERKSWSDLPPAQQAAIRCGEPAFWRFLGTHADAPPAPLIDSAEAADQTLKMLFDIKSKRDLNDVPSSWQRFDAQYYTWRQGYAA